MGLPIISELLGIVDTAIDKIFPDATRKEELKAQLKLKILEQAMEEKKLLFADLQNARELYKEELREQGVWSVVKSIRAMVRPTLAYCSMGFYVFAKLTHVLLNNMDYALLMGVFGFYFGLRTLERTLGRV